MRAQSFGRSLSVILVAADRREQRGLSLWCSRMRAMIRPVDRLGMYGAASVLLCLPETNAQGAEQLAAAVTGTQQAGEPKLRCGVASFPEDGRSADEIMDAVTCALRACTSKKRVQRRVD